MEQAHPAGIYRHYKGNIYEVLTVARHSETLEEMVIYRSVTDGKCWARPLSMWNETVKTETGTVPRFAYLSEAEPRKA